MKKRGKYIHIIVARGFFFFSKGGGFWLGNSPPPYQIVLTEGARELKAQGSLVFTVQLCNVVNN